MTVVNKCERNERKYSRKSDVCLGLVLVLVNVKGEIRLFAPASREVVQNGLDIWIGCHSHNVGHFYRKTSDSDRDRP